MRSTPFAVRSDCHPLAFYERWDNYIALLADFASQGAEIGRVTVQLRNRKLLDNLLANVHKFSEVTRGTGARIYMEIRIFPRQEEIGSSGLGPNEAEKIAKAVTRDPAVAGLDLGLILGANCVDA